MTARPHPESGSDAVGLIRDALPVLYHTGVEPDVLLACAPALVDLLAPPGGAGDADVHRAHRARGLLAAAVADVGPPPCDRALRILLGLESDPARPPAATLTGRRAQAGVLFTPPLLPDTFRRPRHEGRLTRALAFAVFYRLRPDPAAPVRLTGLPAGPADPAAPVRLAGPEQRVPSARAAGTVRPPAPPVRPAGPVRPGGPAGDPAHGDGGDGTDPLPGGVWAQPPPPPAGAFRPRPPHGPR
jgi:hypothetical protein